MERWKEVDMGLLIFMLQVLFCIIKGLFQIVCFLVRVLVTVLIAVTLGVLFSKYF